HQGTCQGGPLVSRDPEEIRTEIEATRDELADTAAALAYKTDVKARAKERVAELRADVADKTPSSAQEAGSAVKRNPLPAAAVAASPKAARLARRHDVVYLNGTPAGRLLPALPRDTRAVLHVHDIVDNVPAKWRRADVVLADSQAVADRLDGLDAHVVGCPIEPEPRRVDPPWPPGHEPVVGYVGRIERRKGVLDLVAAAPQIRSAGARVV